MCMDTALTQGAMVVLQFKVDKWQAWLGIEPKTLDFSSQSGPRDFSAVALPFNFVQTMILPLPLTSMGFKTSSYVKPWLVRLHMVMKKNT